MGILKTIKKLSKDKNIKAAISVAAIVIPAVGAVKAAVKEAKS